MGRPGMTRDYGVSPVSQSRSVVEFECSECLRQMQEMPEYRPLRYLSLLTYGRLFCGGGIYLS